jgi:hypothetical protein
MELSIAREAIGCAAHSRNSQYLIKSEGSLPHVQEPSTCTYPKSYHSSLHQTLLPYQELVGKSFGKQLLLI